jgi:hypothetical protein
MELLAMNRLDELRSQAELPLWIHPLAGEIAQQIRSDLRANTEALDAIHSQLEALIEAQVTFLEAMQRQQSGK